MGEPYFNPIGTKTRDDYYVSGGKRPQDYSIREPFGRNVSSPATKVGGSNPWLAVGENFNSGVFDNNQKYGGKSKQTIGGPGYSFGDDALIKEHQQMQKLMQGGKSWTM